MESKMTTQSKLNMKLRKIQQSMLSRELCKYNCLAKFKCKDRQEQYQFNKVVVCLEAITKKNVEEVRISSYLVKQ